ncbi:hypothetical protein [Hathewaya histolytica]|nr:hypothetical protein [Hathewaya histolytica]
MDIIVEAMDILAGSLKILIIIFFIPICIYVVKKILNFIKAINK